MQKIHQRCFDFWWIRNSETYVMCIVPVHMQEKNERLLSNIRGDNRQNTENRERISNFWKSSSPLPERILRGKAVLSTLDRRAYPYVLLDQIGKQVLKGIEHRVR